MRRSVLLLSALCLGASGAGCAEPPECDNSDCPSDFSWTARADDSSALHPGRYTLAITLEDTQYALDCEVSGTVQDSSCTAPERIEGKGEFDLDVQLVPAGPGQPSPQARPGGFSLSAAGSSDDEPADADAELRGPTEVAIEVRHDGKPLIETRYEVEYEDDVDDRDDERCRSCEPQQRRTHAWTP